MNQSTSALTLSTTLVRGGMPDIEAKTNPREIDHKEEVHGNIPPSTDIAFLGTNSSRTASTDDCFGWIRENTAQHNLIINRRSRLHKVSKVNLCTYMTGRNKTRNINANEIFYYDKYRNKVSSKLWRAASPINELDSKHFFSWILHKNSEENKIQHIFNLVSMHDYSQNKALDYRKTQIYSGKHTEIRATRIDYQTVYNLPATQMSLEKVGGQDRSPKSTKIHVTNMHQWIDNQTIRVQELRVLVEEVIAAKRDKKGVVVHCLAGKGRSGTLISAAVLHESIMSRKNPLGINKNNFKRIVSNLVLDMRNNGGGHNFVANSSQLHLLFEYAINMLNDKDYCSIN